MTTQTTTDETTDETDTYADQIQTRKEKLKNPDSHDTPTIDLLRQLDHLANAKGRDVYPIEDADGALITSLSIGHGLGVGSEPHGSYVKKRTRVLPHDCPKCGHEYAVEHFHRISDTQHSKIVECHVCHKTHTEEQHL